MLLRAPLRLYYTPHCGFCHAMITRLGAELPNVSVELIDVTNDPVILNGLKATYGDDRVPVLLDLGHVLGNTIPCVRGNQEAQIEQLIKSYRPFGVQPSSIAIGDVSGTKPA